MDVRLSHVYHWQRPKLEQNCKQWDLSTEGSVQELRERLTSYIRSCVKGKMSSHSYVFGFNMPWVSCGWINSAVHETI